MSFQAWDFDTSQDGNVLGKFQQQQQKTSNWKIGLKTNSRSKFSKNSQRFIGFMSLFSMSTLVVTLLNQRSK